MKHIKVIIQELQNSGKYQPVEKITKTNKKVSLLEVESLIFIVLTNLSEDYKSAVAICRLVGDVTSMIQGENDGLIPLRDTAIILNTLLEFISHDPNTSAELTKMYLEAYEEVNTCEAVENYLHYKNYLNNLEETL